MPKRGRLSKLNAMKKLLIISLLCFGLVFPSNKAHAMDPKAKAFLVVCGYGTVGGALLGFASLAFGTNSRAVAQGASLGLYTGIIFGAYVLTSYNQSVGPQDPIDTYPQAYPPEGGYPPPGGYPPSGGFGAPIPPEDDGGFFGAPRRVEEINSKLIQNFGTKKLAAPPIYMNLLNIQF